MDWDFTDSQPQGLAKFVIKDGQVYLGSMDDEHAQIIQEQTGGSWFGISSMGWITPDGHPHPAKGWPRPESDEIEAIRVALGDAKLASFDYAAPHEEPATTPHPSGIPRPNQIGDMSDYYEWVGEVVGQGYIPGSVGKGINTKHGEQIRWTTDSESLGLPTHGEVMNTFNIPALDVLNYLAVDEEGKEEDLTDFGSAWNFGASVNANRLAGNLAGWTMTADLHLPSGNAADNLTEVDEISGGAGWRESADESKAQSEAGEDASAPPFELIGSHLEQIPDHPADPESQHENADQKGPEGISIVHTGSLPEDAAVVELTDGQVIVGEADEHHHEIAQRLKIPNTAVKRMGWVNGVGEIKWYSPLTTDIRTQRPEAWYFESPTLDQVSDERNGHKQVGQVEHDHESLWIIDGEHKHSIAQDWIVPEGLEPWVLGQWGKYIVASDGSRYRWLETEQTHHEVVEAMRERGIPIHDYEAGYLDWEGNEGSYWDLSAMSRTIDAVYNQDADTNTHHHEVNVGDPLWQFHLDPVQARSEGEEDKRPDHNQGYAEQHIERIDFHSGSRDEDGKQTPAQKQANDEPIEVHTDSIPQRPDSIEPVLAIEDDQPGYAPAIWDGQQLYVGYGTTDSVTAQEHNELAEEHGLDDEALARASYGAVDPTGEIHWFMGFDANRGWGFKDAAYEDRWSEKGLIFEDGSIEAWVPGKDNNIFHHFQHPRSKESVAQFSTRGDGRVHLYAGDNLEWAKDLLKQRGYDIDPSDANRSDWRFNSSTLTIDQDKAQADERNSKSDQGNDKSHGNSIADWETPPGVREWEPIKPGKGLILQDGRRYRWRAMPWAGEHHYDVVKNLGLNLDEVKAYVTLDEMGEPDNDWTFEARAASRHSPLVHTNALIPQERVTHLHPYPMQPGEDDTTIGLPVSTIHSDYHGPLGKQSSHARASAVSTMGGDIVTPARELVTVLSDMQDQRDVLVNTEAYVTPYGLNPWVNGESGKYVTIDGTEYRAADPINHIDIHDVVRGEIEDWGVIGPDGRKDSGAYSDGTGMTFGNAHTHRAGSRPSFKEIPMFGGRGEPINYLGEQSQKIATGVAQEYETRGWELPEGTKPWTPGLHGKYISDGAGSTWVWAVNQADGAPHHFDLAEGRDAAEYGHITPNGEFHGGYSDPTGDPANWNFSKVADLTLRYEDPDSSLAEGMHLDQTWLPWEPGYFGKGIILSDGRLIHWRVDENSTPYHPLAYDGEDSDYYLSAFWINREGRVNSAWGGESILDKISEADNRLSHTPVDDWEFMTKVRPSNELGTPSAKRGLPIEDNAEQSREGASRLATIREVNWDEIAASPEHYNPRWDQTRIPVVYFPEQNVVGVGPGGTEHYEVYNTLWGDELDRYTDTAKEGEMRMGEKSITWYDADPEEVPQDIQAELTNRYGIQHEFPKERSYDDWHFGRVAALTVHELDDMTGESDVYYGWRKPVLLIDNDVYVGRSGDYHFDVYDALGLDWREVPAVEGFISTVDNEIATMMENPDDLMVERTPGVLGVRMNTRTEEVAQALQPYFPGIKALTDEPETWNFALGRVDDNAYRITSGWVLSEANPDELHVALDIPKTVRQQIRNWVDEQEWPEGTELEDPNDYHITLLYSEGGYGEHEDADWIDNIKGYDAKIVGIDEFGEEKKAIVLRIESPEIKEHALGLQDKAEDHDVEINKFPGGYKPHLTVAYASKKPTDEFPEIEFRTGPSYMSEPRTSGLVKPAGLDKLAVMWDGTYKLDPRDGTHEYTGQGYAKGIFTTTGKLFMWDTDSEGHPHHTDLTLEFCREEIGSSGPGRSILFIVSPDKVVTFISHSSDHVLKEQATKALKGRGFIVKGQYPSQWGDDTHFYDPFDPSDWRFSSAWKIVEVSPKQHYDDEMAHGPARKPVTIDMEHRTIYVGEASYYHVDLVDEGVPEGINGAIFDNTFELYNEIPPSQAREIGQALGMSVKRVPWHLAPEGSPEYPQWSFAKIALNVQQTTYGEHSMGDNGRRPVVYYSDADVVFVGPEGANHSHVIQVASRDLGNEQAQDPWFAEIHDGQIVWYDAETPEVGKEVVENALGLPRGEDWHFGKVAKVSKTDGLWKLSDDDFYHVAPTVERNRILQHGLQPSKPSLNNRWYDEDDYPQGQPPQWLDQQEEGVYVGGYPENVRHWMNSPEHPDMASWDIWRIPNDQVRDAVPDSMVDGAYVIKHPVQPVLHEPGEESVSDFQYGLPDDEDDRDIAWDEIARYEEYPEEYATGYPKRPVKLPLAPRGSAFAPEQAKAIFMSLRDRPANFANWSIDELQAVYNAGRVISQRNALYRTPLAQIAEAIEDRGVDPDLMIARTAFTVYTDGQMVHRNLTPSLDKRFEELDAKDETYDEWEERIDETLPHQYTKDEIYELVAEGWHYGVEGKGISSDIYQYEWITDEHGGPHHQEVEEVFMELFGGEQYLINKDGTRWQLTSDQNAIEDEYWNFAN